MNNKKIQLSDSETCQIITKILNISEEEFYKNIHLFYTINNHILNCLYYLSKMQNDQDRINAKYALEFVYKFDQNPFSKS